MATVVKNFRIKSGLVVEGSTGTINGQNILTETGSDTYILNLIGGETLVKSVGTNLSVDGAGELSLDLAGIVGDIAGTRLSTDGSTLNVDVDGIADDLTGSYDFATNSDISTAISTAASNYDPAGSAAAAQTAAEDYADGLAVNYDPAGSAAAAQTAAEDYADGLAVNYDPAGSAAAAQTAAEDYADGLAVNYDPAGSAAAAQTAAEDYADGLAVNYDPAGSAAAAQTAAEDYADGVASQALSDANAYTDNAVSGLSWKQAVNLLATSDVNMTGSTGTLVIDGHAALDTSDIGYRILLTNQDVDSENGIYTYTEATGTYTLVRSDDADVFSELVGAAVYVMEGTQYGSTSWVQGDHYITDFSGQDWTQFSGQGSVTAGTGITVDGLEVSVNRTTVDAWYDPAGSAAAAQTAAEDYADGLAVNYDPAGSAAAAQTAAEDYADGLAVNYDPAGSAAAAQTAAEDYADGLAVNYDPAGSAAAAQTAAEDYADGLAVNYDPAGSAATAQSNAEATAQNALDDVLDATTPFTSINVNDVAKQVAATTGNIVTAAATTAYSWAAADFRSAKFIVKAKNGVHTQVSDLVVTLDTSNNVAVSEYGITYSNGTELAAVTADYSGSDVRIRVTPANANTEVIVVGTLIK